MLTDTIPTPGWWLCTDKVFLVPYEKYVYARRAHPFNQHVLVFESNIEVKGYTHDPEAVLAWVRDGVLP